MREQSTSVTTRVYIYYFKLLLYQSLFVNNYLFIHIHIVNPKTGK